MNESNPILILVRHGEAESGPVDRERPLSPRGRRQIERLRQMLRERDLTPGEIRHSGLGRAHETAAILTALAPSVTVRVDEALTPGADPDIFASEIETLQGSVLAVSHMPLVELLTRTLLGGKGVIFRTGMTAIIGRGERGWHLVETVDPEHR